MLRYSESSSIVKNSFNIHSRIACKKTFCSDRWSHHLSLFDHLNSQSFQISEHLGSVGGEEILERPVPPLV